MPNVERATTLHGFEKDIAKHGFALWQKVVPASELEKLRNACAAASTSETSSHRADRQYARRNLLAEVPEVAALAESEQLQKLVNAVLGKEFTVVRALLFDKVPDANWLVGWHQDLMIPLAERHDVPGYSAWSVKAGIVHAKPPVPVLEQMLTLRVHLDDCTAENGPLRLISGSFEHGELAGAALESAKQSSEAYVCLAAGGEVLAMRPLTLHASSPAEQPTHRRVVHLEYARPCLPAPLRWPKWA